MTYPNFNEIESPAIRAYNRVAIAHNIYADVGEEKSMEYLKQFDAKEQLQVAAMIAQIRVKGKEEVRKQVFKAEAQQ